MFQQGNMTIGDDGSIYINGVKINLQQQDNKPKEKTVEDLYMGPTIDVEFKPKEEIKEDKEIGEKDDKEDKG